MPSLTLQSPEEPYYYGSPVETQTSTLEGRAQAGEECHATRGVESGPSKREIEGPWEEEGEGELGLEGLGKGREGKGRRVQL